MNSEVVIKMFVIVLVLCALAVQGDEPECGIVTLYGSQSLIIGGKSAQRGEVPWHAGIYIKTSKPYKQICGGSLISNNIIISAAHCFWDEIEKQLPAERYAAAVGKLYRPWEPNITKEEDQKADVKEIHLPVRYQGIEANNQEDIAIVIVNTPFQYTRYVRPICIDFDLTFDRKQLQSGMYGKVAGWGLVNEDGESSHILKLVELPYVDTRTCILESPFSYRPHITGDKFCAGYKGSNVAVCKGDSGGGLAFPFTDKGKTRYYLRGVVSSAPVSEHQCNANTFTSFTQVQRHEYFIRQFWGSTSIDVSAGACVPLPLSLTQHRTGKKAWDKCIEYQEKLVFPCSESATGSINRANKCHHKAGEVFTGSEIADQNEFPHMNVWTWLLLYPAVEEGLLKAICDAVAVSHHADDVVLPLFDPDKNDIGADNRYTSDLGWSTITTVANQALLGYGEVTNLKWLCGGSLISEKFVLTTGVCTSSRNDGPVSYVALGILKRSDLSDQNRFKVKNIHKHPDFKPPWRYNDIAVLEIENVIILSEFLVPACLHTGDDINDERVMATGWGYKTSQGPPSNDLKKMFLTKFNDEECSNKFPPQRFLMNGLDINTQRCYAKTATSGDTCQGDSGGPVQVKSKKIACMYTIVGLTSFGKKCGFDGEPGVYTRVAAYIDWIENLVWT